MAMTGEKCKRKGRNMKIMERKYISKNGVVERTRYAVGDNAQPRRGKRRGNTSFRKQEQNFNSALRRVARILNCNFDHENGLLLTLDYDESGLEKIIAGMTEEDRNRIEEMRTPVGEIGTWKAMDAKERQECSVLQGTNGDYHGEERVETTYGDAWNRMREAAEKQMSLWMRRVKRKFGGKIKALMKSRQIGGRLTIIPGSWCAYTITLCLRRKGYPGICCGRNGSMEAWTSSSSVRSRTIRRSLPT